MPLMLIELMLQAACHKCWPVQVLCESLTYNSGSPHCLQGQQISDCIHKYQPPFREFQVLKVSVDKPGVVNIPAQKSPMMLVCLNSKGSHALLVRYNRFLLCIAAQLPAPCIPSASSSYAHAVLLALQRRKCRTRVLCCRAETRS
jgi:hypothetical protein